MQSLVQWAWDGAQDCISNELSGETVLLQDDTLSSELAYSVLLNSTSGSSLPHTPGTFDLISEAQGLV